MHSKAACPSTVTCPISFLDTLVSYGNDSLWENLSVDGDGKWIQQGIATCSLRIAHGGSYMPEENVGFCSAGIVMYCSMTKKWLKASVADHSDLASNYRGELLGAVLSLLIIKAATDGKPAPMNKLMLHCDN